MSHYLFCQVFLKDCLECFQILRYAASVAHAFSLMSQELIRLKMALIGLQPSASLCSLLSASSAPLFLAY